MSSHTPELANQVLDMNVLDMLMFSINPGYDYQKGSYGIGSVEERMKLYRRCEKEGVEISVMKGDVCLSYNNFLKYVADFSYPIAE